MLSPALLFFLVFAATAQAGKRGLAWPWCKHATTVSLTLDQSFPVSSQCALVRPLFGRVSDILIVITGTLEHSTMVTVK